MLLGIEKNAKAQLRHPVDQHFIVRGVALEPRRLTARRGVLLQRRVQRSDNMGGRRVAPLRRLLHVRPLVVQIERQRRRVAGALFQQPPTDKHEAHSRRPLDALPRGCDEGIEGYLLRVDGNGAKRAHSVDDQALATAGDNIGDLR